jgi:hypothetical protein
MSERRPTISKPYPRLLRCPGWQVTDRDLDMLRWIARHGLVTTDQLARRFFARDDGEVGNRAAYERVRKLTELRLLQRMPTFYREPLVLRVTGEAVNLAEIDVGPANLVLSEVRHSLALVDLVEQLLLENPGLSIQTEREFRVERLRSIKEGKHSLGKGRIPDGILHTPDGKRIAIELDLTSKRTRDAERIIRSYQYEKIDKVWWYCMSPEIANRINDTVRRRQADDFIQVRLCPQV